MSKKLKRAVPKSKRHSAPPSAAIGVSRSAGKKAVKKTWKPKFSGQRLVIDNDPMPTLSTSVEPGSDLRRRVTSDQLEMINARVKQKPGRSRLVGDGPFRLPDFPALAVPKKRANRIAMDEQIIEVNAWATQAVLNSAALNGQTFLGYPFLAELSQIPEYRKITQTIAKHATRNWIELQSIGEDDEGEADKSAKIKLINEDLDNFKVRDLFRKASEVDGFFGRAHLFIDVEYLDDKDLRMPIGNGRDALSKLKVKPGRGGKLGNLRGFKIIEPVWCYPTNYDSYNPLDPTWYNPETWFVMQREIHRTRCIRMVSQEVSDILKPTYAFGGLSMTQIARPYVDNWLRTRQAVADLVWSFSTSGVKTNLSTLMQGSGDDMFLRAEIFNNMKNNRNLMLLDKDTEEFFQINTPLGTLDKLQAQAQEFMASISNIPLVYLLGITPSGLNASSEGEIRAFEDFIASYQNHFFLEPLTTVIDFIQLNRFGQIDPEITFRFVPLHAMNEKEEAEIDKMNAETDDLRINGGVIHPIESRKAVANDPKSRYNGIEVDDLPIPPGEGEPGELDENGDPIPEPIGGKSLDPGKPATESQHSDDNQETTSG